MAVGRYRLFTRAHTKKAKEVLVTGVIASANPGAMIAFKDANVGRPKCPSGSGHRFRHRAVWRVSSHSAIAGGGVDPGRRTRCRRNRAFCYDIRAIREWRLDRDSGPPPGYASSRFDHRLGGPALVARRLSGALYAAHGGLISHGPDFVDQFRRAAAYVNCILKGEKPGDLPVQNPTKIDLSINTKTAQAVGAARNTCRADEVIE